MRSVIRQFNSFRRFSSISGSADKLSKKISYLEKSTPHDHVKADSVIAGTERWVKEFVAGLKLCPFVYKYKRSIAVFNSDDIIHCLEYASLHVQHLMSEQTAVSTKLIVFPHPKFRDLQAFVMLCGAVQNKLRIFRLASGSEIVMFHPCLVKMPPTNIPTPDRDPINFSSRSPYPTMHIFKRQDATYEAINWEKVHGITLRPNQFGIKTIEPILERNRRTLTGLGYYALKRKMDSFYDPQTLESATSSTDVPRTENTPNSPSPLKLFKHNPKHQKKQEK